MNEFVAKLPSNQSFGFFFSFVFAFAGVYNYFSANIFLALVLMIFALIFLFITLTKCDALEPLNKLWMRLGILLGRIVSPIVLGVIFFGLFTPIAILMRLSGRDELRLKFNRQLSYWISRGEPIKSESFKQQF